MKRIFLLLLFCLTMTGLEVAGCGPSPSKEPSTEKNIHETIGPDASTKKEKNGPDEFFKKEPITPDATEPDATEPDQKVQEVKSPELVAEVSKEEPPQTEKTTKEITIAELCQQTAKARCEPFFRCCKGLSLIFKDLQDCEAKSVAGCTQSAGKNQQALLAGHIFINPVSLSKCLSAFKNSGKVCRQPDTSILNLYCGGVFQDKAKINQPCLSKRSGFLCAGGTGRCETSQGGDLSCVPWKKEGELCDASPCAFGLVCLLDPSSSDKKSRCKKPGRQGAYCNRLSDCAKGFACLGSHECSAPLLEGATCTQPGQCAASLACHLGLKKCVKRVAKGAACEAHAQCPSDARCLGLARVGICQKLGSKDAPCVNGKQCKTEFYCSNTSKTCVLRFKAGDACQSSEECSVGLGCDLMSSQCVLLPTEGKTCLFGPIECAKPFTCFSPKKGQRTCKKHSGVGEACTKDNNCLPGLGCETSSNLCVKVPTAGGKCLNGYLCSNSFCDFKQLACTAYFQAGDACKAGHECGPKGACVQKGTTKALVCVPTPQEGQKCLLSCTSGLFCKQGFLKGTCHAEVCASATR